MNENSKHSPRVLVTGCAGFIGSHTTKRLLQDGYTVIGVDSLDPYYPVSVKRAHLQELSHKHFSFHEMDIRSLEFGELLEIVKPSAIIHLAAKAGVRNSLLHPVEYTDINVTGTMRVLEAARAANVSKLLIASSSSVYGTNTKVPFTETDIVENQISPYAASKRALEVMCRMYARTYALNIQLFRFFTVYGPWGRPDMAPFLFTKALMDHQPINVFGSTNTERDYTYVDDIADGLRRALDRKDSFEIYNLGNNKPVSLHEFIQTLEKLSHEKAHIVLKPPQPGDVERTWADISKAQTNLGYAPRTTLKEGLAQFVEWYSTHKELYR